MMCNPDIKTGRYDLITRLEARVTTRDDGTGEIYPADAREAANDLAGPRRRQGILVIDA